MIYQGDGKKMSNSLHIKFDAPLNELDSEEQTFGCRQNNPYICGNNGIPGICAFFTDDKICRKPSRAWKKQFLKLKGDLE